MKVFNKIVSLLLIFLLLVGLCACKNEQENQNEWVATNTTYRGAISDEGYYYVNTQSLLCYVDFHTGANVCLCGKAGCPHSYSVSAFELQECDAYIPGGTGFLSTMFFWREQILYTQPDQYGVQLYRRDSDGTGESKLATLCTDYIQEEPDATVTVASLTVAGQYVYYHATVGTVVENDENILETGKKFDALLRLDLTTGNEEVLVENYEYNCALQLVAARNNSAVYVLNTYPETYGTDDYRDKLRLQPVQVKQWDVDTGDSTVLMEKTRAELGDYVTYRGGMFCCRLDDEWYNIDFDTGELTLDERTVVESGSLRMINSDFAFWRDTESGYTYLKNLNTGEILPNEYGEYIMAVLCEANDAIIISYTIKYDDRSKEEIYVYVHADRLADGLQKSDAVEFYVREQQPY